MWVVCVILDLCNRSHWEAQEVKGRQDWERQSSGPLVGEWGAFSREVEWERVGGPGGILCFSKLPCTDLSPHGSSSRSGHI